MEKTRKEEETLHAIEERKRRDRKEVEQRKQATKDKVRSLFLNTEGPCQNESTPQASKQSFRASDKENDPRTTCSKESL